jgi:hypothetical protein
MLKNILNEVKRKMPPMKRPAGPSLVTLKDMESKIKTMKDDELKRLISDIFSSNGYDRTILAGFLKEGFDINSLYNMRDKGLNTLWDKLQKNIEKILKKMKRDDLLALKDKKTCVKIVKKELRDIESNFCKNIFIAIWDEYKGKMFDSPLAVENWMKEYRFCDAMFHNLKDDELCEIEQEGINSIKIIKKDSDEYISTSTRASVFTITYGVIINGHIKFEVFKSEINPV